MEIKGHSVIAANKQQVWEALNSPDILRDSIPGCESLEVVGENQFKATVVTKIGPIKAKFNGQVELKDMNPPNSYTISGSGSAGAMGAAKGNAYVSLSDAPDGTLLEYKVDADISGKIAQLGSRLIQSTAGILAGQFFKTFSEKVSSPGAAVNVVTEKSGPPAWVFVVGAVALAAIIGIFILR